MRRGGTLLKQPGAIIIMYYDVLCMVPCTRETGVACLQCKGMGGCFFFKGVITFFIFAAKDMSCQFI